MIKINPLIECFFKNESKNADGVISKAKQAQLIRECGFEYVETWAGPKLEDLQAITSSGIKLISCLVNGVSAKDFFPCCEASRAAFLDVLDRTSDNALSVGCKQAIVTSGEQAKGKSYQYQRNVLIETLAIAGEKMKAKGFSINLEVLNTEVNHMGYLLDDPNDGVSIVRECGCDNVKILYDVYHMAIMTGNITEFLRHNIKYIGHFHVAAVPGRHEPAVGETNYPFLMKEIDALGYDGYIGLEYMPLLDSRESLEQTRKYLLS